MSLASPSPSDKCILVFGSNSTSSAEDVVSDGAEVSDIEEPQNVPGGSNLSRPVSMYVQSFDTMVTEVVTAETDLFDAEEVGFLQRYMALDAKARYLYVRLCLRKHQWIRLSELKYEAELGGPDQIKAVMEQLYDGNAEVISDEPTSDETRVTEEEERPEVIDLTGDDQDEPTPAVHPPEPAIPQNAEEPVVPDYSAFAYGDQKASVQELLGCLRIEELKELAKDLKIRKPPSKRDALIATLLDHQRNQPTLTAFWQRNMKGRAIRSNKASKRIVAQGSSDRLRKLVMKKLVSCIRLNIDGLRLIDRVNLVYFRSTSLTPLMQPTILARAKKRAYAACSPKRTPYGPWPTREALLQYEKALALEGEVDELLTNLGSSSKSTTSVSSIRARSNSVVSCTPAPSAISHSSVPPTSVTASPAMTRASVISTLESASPEKLPQLLDEFELDLVLAESADALPTKDSSRIQALLDVVAIYEGVYDEWKDLVQSPVNKDTKGTDTPPRQSNSLDRFHHGHILTRIICKGTHALKLLGKNHRGTELGLLNDLLAQKRFRRGRRGRWHERRACILMHHLEDWRKAYIAVHEALRDPDTHVVYLPKLLRRMRTLQKKLQGQSLLDELPSIIPSLRKPPTETISGTRVHVIVDQAGRLVVKAGSKGSKRVKLEEDSKQLKLTFPSTQAGPSATQAATSTLESKPSKGKSVWVGRDGTNVHVEILALEHYEDQGYKGLHSEGQIVATLFGLLMWDIIFADIPGAFETEYQSAPLDLVEDTFYDSREDLIEAKLKEIELGQGRAIVEDNWDKYADKNTFCVGVRWDLLPKEDILDIVEYFNPAGLATICRTFCQDYANRRGGLPDLFLWHPEHRTCKFVEVKGPGDSLQENQKLWIDVLLTAQVPVEVCYVKEEGTEAPKGKGKVKAKATPAKKTKGKKRARDDEDSDVEEPYVPEPEDDKDIKPVARNRDKKRKIKEAPVESAAALLLPDEDGKKPDVKTETEPVVGMLLPRGAATSELDEHVPSSQTPSPMSRSRSIGTVVEVVVDPPPHKRRRRDDGV